MSRRTKRAWMWVCAAVCVLSCGATGLGLLRPSWWNLGQAAVGVHRGTLEVSWAEAPMKRTESGWDLSAPGQRARILIGGWSWWRPSTNGARIGTMSGSGFVAYSLRAVFVPLWPWTVLAGAAAATLWRKCGPHVRPGHCASCGYDLSGLDGGACPECGLVAKLVRAILRPAAREGTDA